MSEPQLIPLDRIVIDPAVQARARGTTRAVVNRYAEAMKEGAEFPPCDVFFDGEAYVLADGFHRVAAAQTLNATAVMCSVHAGDKRAAILFAVGANSAHGLRRTVIDRRRAVEMLLEDPEWRTRSLSWVSTVTHTSHPFVAACRRRLGLPKLTRSVGLDGKTRNNENMGRGRRVQADTLSVDALTQVVELAAAPLTLIEVCNQLNMAPKRVLAVAEICAAQGKPVHFAPGRDDRALYALRAQLQELGAAKKKLLDELASKEAQLGVFSSLKDAAPCAPVEARKGIGEGKRRQGCPVMILSDLHIEERVTLEKTNGLNEYNPEIAEKCLDRCADAFEWFEKDQRWDMRQAILAIIGDTFSGWIHAELVESNFMSPVQAVVWIQERLERLIRKILATTKIERLIIVCKDGNHGRTSHVMRYSTRTENSLEWLMFQTLATRFTHEPRVEFRIVDALYDYIDVYGKTIAFTHGDQFQYMGGVGGLLIPVRRGLNEIRKYRPVDTFCCGHFHQYTPLQDVHVNGSLVGVTPYSLGKSFAPEPRRQSWFMLDSVNWKTECCPIWTVREPGYQ